MNELTIKADDSSTGTLQTNNNTISSTFSTEISETSLSDISSVALSDTLFNTGGIMDIYDRQITNYRHKCHIYFYDKKMECDTSHCNDSSSMFKEVDTQFASW